MLAWALLHRPFAECWRPVCAGLVAGKLPRVHRSIDGICDSRHWRYRTSRVCPEPFRLTRDRGDGGGGHFVRRFL